MLRRLRQMLSSPPPATSGEVICDGESVPYAIVRSPRRTMSITIRRSDCSVSVRVPDGTPDQTIRRFVEDKREWITVHRRNILNDNSKRIARRYEEGAVHLYLGHPYPLHIVTSAKEGVEIEGEVMTVSVRSLDRCQRVMYAWYARQAETVILEIARPLIHSFAERCGRRPSAIRFVRVKSYWGQCSSNGMIKFNIELMRAPRQCIEYIVVHELCHLVHHNHSPRFHELVTSCMPDWKERKALLEKSVSCRD